MGDSDLLGEFRASRTQERRYSAAKVARLVEQPHHVRLNGKTAWAILYRYGAWELLTSQKQAIRRFERARPNDLWQIDLIEKEPMAIGEVYGVPRWMIPPVLFGNFVTRGYSRTLRPITWSGYQAGKQRRVGRPTAYA